MKLAKKHIAYLTVLAIGGGWLTMDYCTGNAPGEAIASAAVAAQEQASESSGPTALAADMGDEPAIAQRLDKLSHSRQLAARPTVDGFAMPAAFVAVSSKPVADGAPKITAASKFAYSHTLTSVMVGGRGSSVLVDGTTVLKIGDKLDGFTLASVTKNSALFNSAAGGSAVLKFNLPQTTMVTASVQGQ